jgi:hypothetical protein
VVVVDVDDEVDDVDDVAVGDPLGDCDWPPPPPLPLRFVDETDVDVPEAEPFELEHAANALAETTKKSATANFGAFCIIPPYPPRLTDVYRRTTSRT